MITTLLFVLPMATFLLFLLSNALSRALSKNPLSLFENDSFPRKKSLEAGTRTPIASDVNSDPPPRSQLQDYKDLYHQLHNLERFPDALPRSRELLLRMLAKAVERTTDKNLASSILKIAKYDFKTLDQFIHENNQIISDHWENYIQGRRKGQPRALFTTREDACQWLKSISPVRLVDGAWLGHVNGVTTPYCLRAPTKYAWQVFSEELGDGDRAKNHVAVYTDLLDQVGMTLPPPESIEYIRNPNGPEFAEVWESAVAQLLISLFPNDFLPEILGFNLQFELMTMETLQASKELAEVNIDPYYFILHVTIDNIDSGHGAMAIKAVDAYLEAIRALYGDDAMSQAWRRVQSGYLLSENLPTCPKKSPQLPSTLVTTSRQQLEAQLLPIISAKADISQGVHANSKCRFGGKSLVEWLNRDRLNTQAGQQEFFDALSKAKPWVRGGDKEGSKLYKEVNWGGKMFGAFTRSEAALLGEWIDSVGEAAEDAYWTFVQGDSKNQAWMVASQKIQSDPTILPQATISLPKSSQFIELKKLCIPINSTAKFKSLLPLWLTHPCLLEQFVCVPARASTVIGCAVTRFLRAQAGFLLEGSVVDGMDEVSRPDFLGLVEIGLVMAKERMDYNPKSLQEVLDKFSSPPANDMLKLSMKPIQHSDTLLGMAWAFTELHEAIAEMGIVSGVTQEALIRIAGREKASLQACRDQMKLEGSDFGTFHAGHALAKEWIESCFV